MTTEINNKNGSAPPLSNDLLFDFHSSTNIAEIFVDPGDDIRSLVMRGYFKDEKQAIAVILLYDQLNEFSVQEGVDTLLLYVAALCAIKGRSRLEALQALTNILVSSYFGGGKKEVFKGGRNEQQHDGRYDTTQRP